jgi:hypothetical protein
MNMSKVEISLPRIIVHNLIRWVFPKQEDDVINIDEKYQNDDYSKQIAFQVLNQDKQIKLKYTEDFNNYKDIYQNFDKCLILERDAIKTISLNKILEGKHNRNNIAFFTIKFTWILVFIKFIFHFLYCL